MALALVKITSTTVGAGGASSIDFNNIPSIYKDLKIVVSGRSTADNTDIHIQFNNDTGSNYTTRWLLGDGSTTSSSSQTSTFLRFRSGINPLSYTANIFGNCEIYIPNYTSSTAKSVYFDGTAENNATASALSINAGSWTGTAAITSIKLIANSGNFTQYSTATLYGILTSTKATGGNLIYTDGNYWYHVFSSVGTATFSPTTSMSVDYLIVAGGGGGGGAAADGWNGGGGGAGGLLTGTTNVSYSNYSFVVGDGGARGTSSATNNGSTTTQGSDGGNSSAFGLTAIGGGGGGAASGLSGGTGSKTFGRNGGSGGGGATNYTGATPTGGTGTSGQGNNGGAGSTGGTGYGGGGGGSGGAGSGPVTGSGGGVGTASSITGTSVTYAKGGGTGIASPSNAAANTGNGGDAAYAPPSTLVNSGNGGSGIIVIRYAK